MTLMQPAHVRGAVSWCWLLFAAVTLCRDANASTLKLTLGMLLELHLAVCKRQHSHCTSNTLLHESPSYCMHELRHIEATAFGCTTIQALLATLSLPSISRTSVRPAHNAAAVRTAVLMADPCVTDMARMHHPCNLLTQLW